jgi:triacylglycerol lipase
LGGALATLAVAKLRYENDKPIYGLYTFGQPRAGNRDFERTFNNDVVPRIPLRLMKYSHVGTFIFFDQDGNIHSDMGWWYRLLDNFTGRIEDFLKPGTDGIKDHDMAKYVANLEKNISIYPKL